MADAASVLASGAALVMVGTGRPTIDPPVSLKALFGIEDADTVGARALHQVDGHTLAFFLAYAHPSLLHLKSCCILVLNLIDGARQGELWGDQAEASGLIARRGLNHENAGVQGDRSRKGFAIVCH